MDIYAGANLVVTGIQQPQTIQICEDLVVAVDIHNAGDAPGGGQLVAGVVLEDQTPLAASGAVVPEMAPCDTDKIVIDFGHVEEAWRGVVIVVAGFPANPLDPQPEEMFPCPLMVLSPPVFEVTGIQQPAVVQPCEDITIGVDVHNSGDKPGACEAVAMWIEDEMGLQIWPAAGGHAISATTVLDPCMTDKVPFGPIHVDEAWLGQTITVFAQACGGLPTTCDIIVTGGPCIVVTGIQQPAEVYPDDNLTISVDIHNAGGKTGSCEVYVELQDATGTPIVTPAPVATGTMNPCDTNKVVFDLGTVSETWEPGVTVVASACCGDPVLCPIDVIVIQEPPVPEPCCWCIYDVDWWALPNTPPNPTTSQEYFAMHTVEWLDPGHTEEIEGLGTHVIPDPSWHQVTSFYGGPEDNGYAEGEWDELLGPPPGAVRTNSLLGTVTAQQVEYWNSSLTMLNWKNKFVVKTPLGIVTLFAVTFDITAVEGNAGWPFTDGSMWTSSSASSITPPSVGVTKVEGTTIVTVPAFPGGIECFIVNSYSWDDTAAGGGNEDGYPDPGELTGPTGTKYYNNDYGCPIKNDAVPGGLYDGYETQDMIWYCMDPPFPPFQP
jgi:hypothetical protein